MPLALFSGLPSISLAPWLPTVEEDQEDEGVGELLATQQVDVLHTQVHGQLDDGPVLHVRSDVGHQGQVLHQAARLPVTNKRTKC